ncbi:MAG: Chromosome-partitioning protein Spo0J [Calditrichaeota bacterium]|nr:Chromosome-partitioning protein Spo0J [Calditrichota bacterium]
MTPRPKGGLGRGLSALIPDVDDSEARAQADEVELARIRVREDQPRARFDPKALAELVESVRAQGVLVPLIITPRDPGYLLVAGERRLRAAKAAGLITVPCRVVPDLSDRDILEISLVENLQREDLNAVELARGYHRLIEEMGYTQQQVSERVGKDRATVANTLRLLSLPEPVLRMLVDEELSQGHARALLSLTGDGSRLALAREIVDRGLSVREVERRIRGRKGGAKKTPGRDEKKRRDELAARQVSGELQDILAMPVKVAHRGKGGQITIRYSSLDELDRLIARLRRGRSA